MRKPDVGGGSAVHTGVVDRGAGAVGVEGVGLGGVRRAVVGRAAQGDARHGAKQRLEIPPLGHRQIHQGAGGHLGAHLGPFGLQHGRRFPRHENRFQHLAQGEARVHPAHVVERHRRLGGVELLKAGGAEPHAVRPRGQRRETVVARAVGLRGARKVGGGVVHRHLGVGDDGSGLIANLTNQRSIEYLGAGGPRQGKTQRHPQAQRREKRQPAAGLHVRTPFPRGLPGSKANISGIDVVWDGRGGQVEYDVVVAPGAKPGRVRMRFERGSRFSPSLSRNAARPRRSPPWRSYFTRKSFSSARRRAAASRQNDSFKANWMIRAFAAVLEITPNVEESRLVAGWLKLA